MLTTLLITKIFEFNRCEYAGIYALYTTGEMQVMYPYRSSMYVCLKNVCQTQVQSLIFAEKVPLILDPITLSNKDNRPEGSVYNNESLWLKFVQLLCISKFSEAMNKSANIFGCKQFSIISNFITFQSDIDNTFNIGIFLLVLTQHDIIILYVAWKTH